MSWNKKFVAPTREKLAERIAADTTMPEPAKTLCLAIAAALPENAGTSGGGLFIATDGHLWDGVGNAKFESGFCDLAL